jgi:hypothetical protein
MGKVRSINRNTIVLGSGNMVNDYSSVQHDLAAAD